MHSSAKTPTRANDKFKKSLSNTKSAISKSQSLKSPATSDHGSESAADDLRSKETPWKEQETSDNERTRRRKTLEEVTDAGEGPLAGSEGIPINASKGDGEQVLGKAETGSISDSEAATHQRVEDTSNVEPIKPKKRGRPSKKDMGLFQEDNALAAGKSGERASDRAPKTRRPKKSSIEDGKDMATQKTDSPEQEHSPRKRQVRSPSTKKPRIKAPAKNWPAGCSPAEYLFVENKHASTGGRPLGDKARINIVSPSLCGTVLVHTPFLTYH